MNASIDLIPPNALSAPDLVSAPPSLESQGTPVASLTTSDRINELYRGEIFTEETSRIARDRIHWMCAQCEGDTVLDVGCSQGITSILLAREGMAVTAIDTDSPSINYARAEFAREPTLVQQRITLLETDLLSLPREAIFDSVVLGEVLEHQALPERFVRSATERAKPAGKIIITTPFALHPHPDHRISVMPRHIVEIADTLSLQIDWLDVCDGYIRCVMRKVLVNGTHRHHDVAALLAITEAATLASQRKLFERLEERAAQLRKRTEALKAAEDTAKQQKISLNRLKASQAEAATSLQEATKQHKSAIHQLQNSHKAALTELQAKSDQEILQERTTRAQAELLARTAREQAASALAVREREIRETLGAKAEQEVEALQLTHKHQLAQLQNQIAVMKAVAASTKSASAYRLGRALIRAAKSPTGALSLPKEMLSIGKDAWQRKRSRGFVDSQVAIAPIVANPAKRSPAASAIPRRAPMDVEQMLTFYQQHGLTALKNAVKEYSGHGDRSTHAIRVLQLAKSLSASGDKDVEFDLADFAMSIERSDHTLRGYFWAAQKSGRFEEACEAIRGLDQLYGNRPSDAQQKILTKLRESPAYQLTLLSLVVTRPFETVVTIPKRLCYVLHNSLPYSSGGYGTRSHGVAAALIGRGYDVASLTRPGFPLDIKPELIGTDIQLEDRVDNIRYVRTLSPLRRGLTLLEYVPAAADAIELRLRELQPACVMAASNHVTALPALIAARRLGMRFIYEVRGLWEITRISRETEFKETAAFAIQRLLETRVSQLADHVFTLTEAMREELVERGVARSKIALLPNCCDPDRFMPRERDAALGESLGIAADTPVIGYVGTFVDYEGLDDLALSCAILKRRGVVFRLLLVGNENASGLERGPISEHILSIANTEGYGDWLIMPGRVPHEAVESYYSLIDVAAFPRKPLPVCEMVSPLKPLEALAMEKAVLVSSVRALAEMVEGEQRGLVFEKGNITDLADKLQLLLVNSSLRQQLGRAGRQWVISERNWAAVGKTIDSTLLQVAAIAEQDRQKKAHL